MYIYTNITVEKKVKIKAWLHSICWIKIPRLNFFEIFPTFSLVVIGQRLRKLCVSYLFLGKLVRFIHFYMNILALRMGMIFLMWWIRECQEGQFIPCNTAQLIAKCPSKNVCYFLVKESKNKNLFLVLKNFWL